LIFLSLSSWIINDWKKADHLRLIPALLKNIDTGITASTRTDEGGDFQFTNVKIGNYCVSAEKQGFSTAVAERVNVTINARQRVDLTMQPGALTENVVVTAGVALLETDSSGRGQVVQREQIVNLPLNGRSYTNLPPSSAALLCVRTFSVPW
jgi:hypothetical protein